MNQAKSPFINSFSKHFLYFLLLGTIILGCDPKKASDEKTDTNTTTDNPPPECPPVAINELYKLELLKADYDALIAGAPAKDGLTFQFAYIHGATKRLTLVAYATKPGRDFAPLTLKHLNILDAQTIDWGEVISMGDQKVKLGGGNGLTQLINGSGHSGDFYSLTFTPSVSQSPYTPIGGGPQLYVRNIKYRICVKYETSPGVFTEYCGAGPVDTQPSPPANY